MEEKKKRFLGDAGAKICWRVLQKKKNKTVKDSNKRVVSGPGKVAGQKVKGPAICGGGEPAT